ncbi:MAG: 1-acyl-sn-glycerol-3-phosphate acyltransferase [Bacteroidetes bacterium]|nr:1-acyl-sn-glycerol-3-phosphate acyltransferase [Bacteroidota bacterium]
MRGFILRSYDYFEKNRLAFWLAMVSSSILFTVLALRVSFEEDISKMLQMDAKTREYSNILRHTRVIDKLTVCITGRTSGPSSDQVKMAYCDSLVVRIKTLDSTLVKRVVVNPGDFPFMDVYKALLRNLPFFMEPRDYAYADSALQPERIRENLTGSARLLSSPAGIFVRQRLPWDPAGISNPLSLRLQKLGEATGYEMNNGYFFSKDRKNLLLFIEPANPPGKTGLNKHLIDSLEGFISELNSSNEFSSVDCTFFGATAVSVENARQIQHDAALTLAVMCVALVLLITSVFRKKRTPVLIFLPILFGMAFALACVSFIKEDISLIAIGATSVLLGIAVNYPLHILTHRLQERDLRKVIGDMVEPMTIGSATTIGGFVCLLFVKAEILYDFGLLGAFGLIGAVLFSLIFLPHLVGKPIPEGKLAEIWLKKAGHIQLENSAWLRWGIILLTPVFLYFSQDIEFDSNLMHLNYMSPKLKKAEQLLRGHDSLVHSMYVISYGNTFDEALASCGKIKYISDSLNLAGKTNAYSGVADFLPSLEEQERRVSRWNQYFTSEKTEAIQASVSQSGRTSGFKDHAFDDFYSLLGTKAAKIDDADYRLLSDVFAREVVTVSPEMTTIVSVLKMPASSRGEVEKIISGLPGTRLLDNNFVSSHLSSVINDDFNFIAIFSALMVFIALLLTYGKLELAITAFVPMVVSWIWILGLMGFFHIRFNIVNIILSTFIFGLGDDYCIFTMDGLIQEYRGKMKTMPVIRMSILLSGITTLIGFGVLLIAKHPAIQSIALVSIIGIVSVLLISQVLEPYLFRMFISGPVSRGFPPVGILTFFQSVFAYTFFITGCILLTISGFFLLVINPFYRKRSKKIFNAFISKFAWAQLYVITSVTKRVVFDEKPDFGKPCVFVANHQSVLDILSMIMLSPRIVLLTNKWVWNSPLFGYVVRLAGYHPIFEGADPAIDTLKTKIEEGYSIAIFPEGTRSRDGKIGRFHKGAFYLAQKLELDIIPVLFHGTGRCIAKGSFIVRATTFTIKVLPRIDFSDSGYGTTYQEKTKAIHELMKRSYALLDEDARTPALYHRRIVDNFIFKGPVLEWYMKVKLRMEKDYQLFDILVPKEGVIIDAGCGYGFMDYMLAYLAPHRDIVAFDYDESKVEVAQNGFDKPANLRFVHASLEGFQPVPANCIIFSDVLHYLGEQERNRIFARYAAGVLPGGMIIVRDGDNHHGNRHAMTRFTEFLSTRIFKFNKTAHKLAFFSAEELMKLGKDLGFESGIIDQQKWNSNLVIVFKKR